MFAFLQIRAERFDPDEIKIVLGELSLLPDGCSIDSGAQNDWKKCVALAKANKVQIHTKINNK